MHATHTEAAAGQRGKRVMAHHQALLLTVLAGCGTTIGPEPRDWLADGLIRGVVTAAGGGPLDSIYLAVHVPTADTGHYGVGNSTTITSSNGSYEMGVIVTHGEFPDGVPDTLQLYLLAEKGSNPHVVDSVLVGVAVAEPGESLRETKADVVLALP